MSSKRELRMLRHLNNVNKIPVYLWKESEHATPKYASLVYNFIHR